MIKKKSIALILFVALFGGLMIGCQEQPVATVEVKMANTATSGSGDESAASDDEESAAVEGEASVDEATKEPVTEEEAEASVDEPEPTATADIRLDPEDWRNWPVVPEISGNAISLYENAVANGADPTHFSKIGDCQNVTSYFLADFDRGRYRLGEEYDYLQETIDHYAGSWKRESLAVQGGFNVASVMSPLSSDPEFCETDESPLECEFRLYNPSIVIISMETWWNHDDPTKYEFYMRHLLDKVIEHGALPIIATKADNLEGDHTINRSIAQLAYEYDIPMWNFWAATDPLPNHGLVETTVVDGEEVDDNFHLTIGLGNYFDDPDNTVAAWPIRNLTALQTINAVYQAVKDVD